jgi:hypothetical protein
MDLDSFTANSEEIICSDSVRLNERDGIDERPKGQLACTDERVLFINSSNAININPKAVSSIEYNPSNWMNIYTLAAAGLFALTAVIWLFFDTIPIISGFPKQFTAFGLIAISASILLEGLLRRNGQLKILTNNKSYEFQTSNNQFAKKMCAAVHSVQE